MRKFILGLATCLAIGTIWAGEAWAHVIEGDEPISVLLHVAPNDDPVVGQPAILHFQFSDPTRAFAGEACDCTAAILRGSKEMYSQVLFAHETRTGVQTASFSFTFPEADVYTVHVDGAPRAGGKFQPFALNYTVQVVQAPSLWGGYFSRHIWHDGKLSPHVLHLAGAGMVGVVFGGMVFQDRVLRRRTSSRIMG